MNSSPPLRPIVRLLLCAAALMLASCAQPSQRCELVARGKATFSAADSPDTIEARSLGEQCAGAAAVFLVRDPHGVPIWAWAAPFYPAFGDSFAPHAEGTGPSRAQVSAFLSRWTHVDVLKTSAAPVWSDGIETPLDRTLYEDIRARDLPMLCHLVRVARQQCVYWEPAAASADALYQRDVGPPPAPEEEDGRSDRALSKSVDREPDAEQDVPPKKGR